MAAAYRSPSEALHDYAGTNLQWRPPRRHSAPPPPSRCGPIHDHRATDAGRSPRPAADIFDEEVVPRSSRAISPLCRRHGVVRAERRVRWLPCMARTVIVVRHVRRTQPACRDALLEHLLSNTLTWYRRRASLPDADSAVPPKSTVPRLSAPTTTSVPQRSSPGIPCNNRLDGIVTARSKKPCWRIRDFHAQNRSAVSGRNARHRPATPNAPRCMPLAQLYAQRRQGVLLCPRS